MGVLAGSSRWSCPKLGESRRTGCVDKAVGDPVTAVLLPSSCPHDGFSRKGLGGRIPSVPMEHLSHLHVLSDVRMDARVAVGLGWIRRVVGCWRSLSAKINLQLLQLFRINNHQI